MPFTSISPRSLTLYDGDNSSFVDCDMCICIAWLVASMRDAVFTESPNKQYLGIFKPTIPATTAPLWTPTRIWRWRPENDDRIGGNDYVFTLLLSQWWWFPTCGTIFQVCYRLDHIECHVAHAIRVIVLLHRSAGHHHIGVSDRFNLQAKQGCKENKGNKDIYIFVKKLFTHRNQELYTFFYRSINDDFVQSFKSILNLFEKNISITMCVENKSSLKS